MVLLRLTAGTIALLVALLVATNCSAQGDPLARARELLAQGRAADAYALLAPLADERAGNPDFDYVYGVSAVDAGEPLAGVFALERVVDQQPDNGPARAELARAYLALGDTDEARDEFDKLSAMDVPDDVQRTIDRYLSSIDQYHLVSRTQIRPHVRAGGGYDSNINSATDQNQVAAPALGGLIFTLADTSRELDSGVGFLGAGVNFTAPISLERGLSVFGTIDFEERVPFAENDFESTAASGRVGLHLRQGRNQFRASLDGNVFKIDGSSIFRGDRGAFGTTLQWQHALTENDQVSLFGQAQIVRYPDQEVRDVNRYVGGASWAHAMPTVSGTPVVFLSGFGGHEAELDDVRGKHFGRNFYGVRIGGQKMVHEGGRVFGSFTYQRSDYDGPDPVFVAVRDDDYFNVEAGYRYNFDEHWSVTPKVGYTNNDSNIVTNAFDRVEFLVTVRNDF